MQINFSSDDKTLVVRLSGEIDHHSAADIRLKTDFKLQCGNIKTLVFDFTDLKFMDSSGIGVIIGRYKLMKSVGGRVIVVSPNQNINRILSLSGIRKLVSIYDNIEDAFKEVNAG